MRTQPTSFQPGNDFHSRSNYLLQPVTALCIPRRVLQLEGGDLLSHTAHAHDQSESIPLETNHFLTTGCEELVNLSGRLRPFLSANYPWLGQDDLEVIGTHPVDAGGFANVWVGKMGDRRIAVKSYRCWASADHVQIYERFHNEALACARLSEQNVVPFLGVYSTRVHPFALVFEFMDHLSLGEYLSNNHDVRRIDLVLEIAHAVKHMHSLDVVHGNIRITNILVDADGHARVAGLGATSVPSVVPRVDVDRFFPGAAPELIDPQRFRLTNTGATKASDMYVFGVLTWEVFAGRIPFSNENRVAGVYSMLKGRRPARPDHPQLSDRVWKVIKGCWKGNPARRMAIAEVVTILDAEVNAHKSY